MDKVKDLKNGDSLDFTRVIYVSSLLNAEKRWYNVWLHGGKNIVINEDDYSREEFVQSWKDVMNEPEVEIKYDDSCLT